MRNNESVYVLGAYVTFFERKRNGHVREGGRATEYVLRCGTEAMPRPRIEKFADKTSASDGFEAQATAVGR